MALDLATDAAVVTRVRVLPGSVLLDRRGRRPSRAALGSQQSRCEPTALPISRPRRGWDGADLATDAAVVTRVRVSPRQRPTRSTRLSFAAGRVGQRWDRVNLTVVRPRCPYRDLRRV
jgi:hypothetical protein